MLRIPGNYPDTFDGNRFCFDGFRLNNKRNMKKERTDALINKKAIAKDILINPLKTQRERAEDLWVWKTTVQEHLQELKTTKDDRIIWITDKDLSIVRLWLDEIERRLRDKEELEKMRTSEISQVIKENTARYAIFRTIDNPNSDNNIIIQI